MPAPFAGGHRPLIGPNLEVVSSETIRDSFMLAKTVATVTNLGNLTSRSHNQNKNSIAPSALESR